jgi:hypothetical protein
VVLMLRAGSKPMLHFYPKADCSRCWSNNNIIILRN